MAAYLGLDPAKDVEFFWIADEALDAPLPDGWAEHEDAHGPFFYHVTSKRAYRQHPLDDYVRVETSLWTAWLTIALIIESLCISLVGLSFSFVPAV